MVGRRRALPVYHHLIKKVELRRANPETEILLKKIQDRIMGRETSDLLVREQPIMKKVKTVCKSRLQMTLDREREEKRRREISESGGLQTQQEEDNDKDTERHSWLFPQHNGVREFDGTLHSGILVKSKSRPSGMNPERILFQRVCGDNLAASLLPGQRLCPMLVLVCFYTKWGQMEEHIM